MDTGPQQCWRILKSNTLTCEDTNNIVELQAGFTELTYHFKTKGETHDLRKCRI